MKYYLIKSSATIYFFREKVGCFVVLNFENRKMCLLNIKNKDCYQICVSFLENKVIMVYIYFLAFIIVFVIF